MSATLVSDSTPATEIALRGAVDNDSCNGAVREAARLAVVEEVPVLREYALRSGSVQLARISHLIDVGERLGMVDTNYRGVRTLVVDTKTHGAIRVLDFTATASGLDHPYRVQRLHLNPEDFYVNSRTSEKSAARPHPKRASYVQGGLSKPEFNINELINAASNTLLMMAEPYPTAEANSDSIPLPRLP